MHWLFYIYFTIINHYDTLLIMKKKIVSYALDEKLIKKIQDESKKLGISASAFLTLVLKGKIKL